MGGKNTPSPPNTMDYIQMANVQKDVGRELMEEQTRANRPNQFTPFGQTTWEQDAEGNWTQRMALVPEAQAALEAQQRLGRGRSEMAEDRLAAAEQELSAPLQWNALQANQIGTGADVRQRAEDALFERATSRLNPMWEQREEAARTRLFNQGLRPGDAAWDTAMANLGRERTDAFDRASQQAIIGGGAEAQRQFGMDMQRRQQAIAEQLRRRGVALGDVGALTAGQQVSAPNMPSFSRQGLVQTPDFMRAMQLGEAGEMQKMNAKEMQDQGTMSGIMSTASTLAPLALMAFSDKHSKHDQHPIGEAEDGTPVHVYTNRNDEVEVGVMAQDMPEENTAVASDGTLMVDVSKLPAPVSGEPVKPFGF